MNMDMAPGMDRLVFLILREGGEAKRSGVGRELLVSEVRHDREAWLSRTRG
jgi:hypothetical protein